MVRNDLLYTKIKHQQEIKINIIIKNAKKHQKPSKKGKILALQQ